MDELIFLLRHAKAVVGPSTGVLHLAASSRTPVVGIYSPVLSHSAVRWAPRGENVKVLSPDSNQSPLTQESMGQVTVESVLKALNL